MTLASLFSDCKLVCVCLISKHKKIRVFYNDVNLTEHFPTGFEFTLSNAIEIDGVFKSLDSLIIMTSIDVINIST
jgi:hypothetical protein